MDVNIVDHGVVPSIRPEPNVYIVAPSVFTVSDGQQTNKQ